MLSLATDLAMGQPLEHGLRTAVLALRTAQTMGLSGDDQVAVFYTGVLHFAGCTAESEIDARFFGNELAARPRMMTVAHGSRLELIATAMRVAHQDSGPLARAVLMARAAFGGVAEFRKWAASHCDVARLLGARMGLSGQVEQALRHLYERWDGNGMPGELSGLQVPLAVRLMQVAQDADLAWQHGGTALVRSTRQRLGQARPAGPRRARAGPAARLPQRAGARGLPRAAPAGAPGRLPRRAVRRVRLPPGQPVRRPAGRLLAAGGGGLLPGDARAAGVPSRPVGTGRGGRTVPGRGGRQASGRGGAGGADRSRQPPRPVPRPAGLSGRECEVLSLIARGMATKQVARQLGISPKTCDHHIQRLYRKTGLSTRAGATLFALEHGLIPPG